jgi:malate dehydrogenase (oxaloacetate-decarboxylating)(NADP+)
MAKPVHILQRGDSVRSIVNLAALAVVEAQRRRGDEPAYDFSA